MTIEAVIQTWRDSIPFFPSAPDAQADLAVRIACWLGAGRKGITDETEEQLRYLDTVVPLETAEWRGLEHVRKIFLRRYPMPQGVEQWDPEVGTYYLDTPAIGWLRGVEKRTALLSGPSADSLEQPHALPFAQSITAGHTCSACAAKDAEIARLRAENDALRYPDEAQYEHWRRTRARQIADRFPVEAT